MSERITLSLWEPVQAKQAFNAAWERAKALTMAGHRLTLTLAPATRSNPQNRLLHALIADIAAQVEWAGAKREPEVWKRLLTAAWSRVHETAADSGVEPGTRPARRSAAGAGRAWG